MKIRAYLLIMVGAIILPISLFAAVALQTLLRSEREAALRTLEETASATTLLVDRELSSAEAALRVLAHSPHLAHGDMRAFYEHARSADRGKTGRTILFDPTGQQIINTVIPLGQALPPPPPYVRVRTRQVIDSQRTVVSGLITGAVQRVPVTTINIPVPLGEGRRYVLASVFGTEYFSELIAQRAVPSSWTLAVIDRDGRFIARTRELDRIGLAANPGLLQVAAGKNRGLLRTKTMAGLDAYYAFARSPMSGWLVAVSAPAAEIEGAARRAVMLAAAGMLVALLCAAGAAIFFARRLVASIRGAASAATTLGHGGVPAAAAPVRIAEVSELHRSIDEAARKLAEAQAERASLLEREQEARVVAEQQVRIRDEFLAMLSHELRNPLSGIVGAAQLLRMDTASPALKRHAQDILLRQGKHLTRIVDDLLDLARLARGKVQLDLRPVDLAAVVESTVDALRVAGRVEHQLGCRLEPAWVLADRTRIEQVVGNLVTNALKYTPKGGTIDITLTNAGGEARLVVHDSGVGIAPELMPQLFDIFVQGKVSLDRTQGGLGIGLSLVRSLVGLHGGTISAESAGTGQGSSFTLRLPLLDEGGGDSPRTARKRMQDKPSGAPILLIEDNHDARQMLAAQLVTMGYRVLEADNGPEGLVLARREHPGLAIVDIGLPGMNGYEVAAQVRRDPVLEQVRLVALTGYGQEADRQRALDAGFDAHLVKPLKFEELAALLDTGSGR